MMTIQLRIFGCSSAYEIAQKSPRISFIFGTIHPMASKSTQPPQMVADASNEIPGISHVWVIPKRRVKHTRVKDNRYLRTHYSKYIYLAGSPGSVISIEVRKLGRGFILSMGILPGVPFQGYIPRSLRLSKTRGFLALRYWMSYCSNQQVLHKHLVPLRELLEDTVCSFRMLPSLKICICNIILSPD